MQPRRAGILLYATLLLFTISTVCSAQQYLTGEVSGVYPKDNYIISGTIHVLPKTTLTFAAGCCIRFENYTGIVVRGQLICKGTHEQPIMLTSYRDIATSPTIAEAFDWNGIKLTPEARGITLEYCTLAHSTFGLNIESSATPVVIRNVIFHQNGSSSIIRDAKKLQIRENKAISFFWPDINSFTAAPAEIDTATRYQNGTQKKLDSAIEKKPNRRTAWMHPVRIGSGSIAVIGGITGIIGGLLYNHYALQISRNDERPFSSQWPSSMRKEYMADLSHAKTAFSVGIGAAIIGATGFSITFFF